MTHNRLVHIKQTLYQIISSLLGPYEATYLGSLSLCLHFLFEVAQRGSTVSDIEASAYSNFPVPVSLKTKLHESFFFYRAPEEAQWD